MTAEQRAAVVELLEMAHGYAIAGSIMPFRSACVMLGVRGTETAKTAGELIDRARDEMRLSAKPATLDYVKAIGVALERAENGTWP